MGDDSSVLGQMIDSLHDALLKLEEAGQKNEIENFSKIKSFMLDIQKKITAELEKNA